MTKAGTKKRRIVSKKNAVRIARLKQGLETEDFAELVGVSPAQIINIENGSGTSEKTALMICRKLRAEFDDLFEVIPGSYVGGDNGNGDEGTLFDD